MAEKKKAVTKLSKISKKPKVAKVAAKTEPKTTGLVVKVFDLKGKITGSLTLPKEIFGQTPNEKLLAQAVRVYASNLTSYTAHTKTRGEVRGGGAKPWRQKGTGRARAGSRRSPLWVGGGTTFGPRAKVVKLALPQKMRKKALIYALSQQAKSGNIKVITNIENVAPKTKPIAALLKVLDARRDTLLVVSQKNQNLKLATRNISNLSLDIPQNLNAYEVLKINDLLLSKEAITKFAK